jgi:hypothetical protein
VTIMTEILRHYCSDYDRYPDSSVVTIMTDIQAVV